MAKREDRVSIVHKGITSRGAGATHLRAGSGLVWREKEPDWVSMHGREEDVEGKKTYVVGCTPRHLHPCPWGPIPRIVRVGASRG